MSRTKFIKEVLRRTYLTDPINLQLAQILITILGIGTTSFILTKSSDIYLTIMAILPLLSVILGHAA